MPVEQSTVPEPAPLASDVSDPRRWRLFWQTVTKFDRGKVIPQVALRNTLGVAIPLLIGVLTGYKLSGLAVATGALNVSYSDGEDSYSQRAHRMLAAGVLTSLTVFIGGLAGRHDVSAILIATVWAFAAGMAVSLGTTAGDLGVISLVTLVVYSAQALSTVNAAWAAVLALCGSLFQTGIALFLWPVRRYQPERHALGELYLELAKVASGSADPNGPPPASQASTMAQQILSSLGQDHRVESERYRSLLNQAERIRLCLLAFGRLHRRLRREPEATDVLPLLERIGAVAADLLYAASSSLLKNEDLQLARADLRTFSSLTAEFQNFSGDLPRFVMALIADARLQVEALGGQFRVVIDLTENSTPQGLITFAEREASRPASLRLAGALAILQANLTLESAACRHAIRLAACVAIGDSFGRFLDWRRSYWLPMTIAIVLKPDFTSTFSRGVLRLAGTFLGLALATVLLHFFSPSLLLQVAFVGLFTYALRCVGPANYGLFVISVSGLIVFLVGLTGVSAGQVISARAINTAAGGVFALLAYWVWPTWEKTQVREQFARMLDAYRRYLQTLTTVYSQATEHSDEKMTEARLASRLARSNAEASVDRLGAEPGVDAGQVSTAVAMLASSHRFVHALMALDAGLASSSPVPARDAFKKLTYDMDLTLYLLAAVLRGSPFSKKQFPNLRDGHRRLLESGDAGVERYALVNIETDRMTNSLNTLREQVSKLVSPRP